ncbi:YcnI family protein [Tersicoccus sp. MR15.9]|uniref:YcnI family copper-binding membrane protein n=1 Tax=Tersicoccus mangrovi TaxID=3121635 RepID=UPI002FE64C16
MRTPLRPSLFPHLRRAVTATTVSAATAGLLLLGAGAASAHVHVVPDTTAADGYAHLTFNVPSEESAADTAKVAVDLPTATPFTSVSVRPIEGWTAKLTTTTLPKPVVLDGTTVTKAVTSVTWTADATHRLHPHEYQAFDLSVGKLPAQGTTVALPTTQTYSNGHVVRWNQPAKGSTEPENPLPSFTTTAAGSEDGHDASSGHAVDAAPAASVTTTSTAAGWGLGLGLAGFVLGAVALAVALLNRRRHAVATREAGR